MAVHTMSFQRFAHRNPVRAPAPRIRPAAGVTRSDFSSGCPCGGPCPRCAGPGERLDAGLQTHMEGALNTELSGVRVHTDSAADEAARHRSANAFTIGQHLFFARGQYAPHTPSGQRRIAHELTHVAQQRLGRASSPEHTVAERESEQAAGTLVAGGQVRPRVRGGGLVQAQASGASPGLLSREQPRRFLSGPEFQLHLDPDLMIEFQLQQYLRFWVGTTVADGEPPSPPEPPTPETPLPSRLWQPIRPESYDPDVGAVLAPYGARGVPFSARDPNAALSIYQRNYSFVQLLPDLRSHAPSIFRPLIPSDWRRRIAGALTSSAVDSALRGQYPTPIETSDRFFENITGVKTTYIPLPGISF